MSSEIEIPPLRPLSDFILESSRFQFPTGKDHEKLNKRILNNLLYYQTNYYAIALSIFLLVGLFAPSKMLIGIITTTLLVMLFLYCTKNKHEAMIFKRKHPAIFFSSILLLGYFVLYFIQAMAVFSFGITLPIILIIVHSSMRMRNIKNKLANTMETIGMKTTPMGILLEGIGLEEEA